MKDVNIGKRLCSFVPVSLKQVPLKKLKMHFTPRMLDPFIEPSLLISEAQMDSKIHKCKKYSGLTYEQGESSFTFE